jgi:exodeoxyribonuclease VII small subunit
MSEERGPARPPDGAARSFEEALARLESIVRELEGSDLTLEETLARYEEGSLLVRECTRQLEEAEQRIRVLAAAREASAGGEGARGAGAGESEEGDEEVPGDELPF